MFQFHKVQLKDFVLYSRLGPHLFQFHKVQLKVYVGINVKKIGYISFLYAGVLCGFGGAFMSMGWVSFFMKNMVNGRGYIGLSAMNIAEGNPVGSAIAAVFFGFSDALATTLKSQGGNFPTEFLDMIPYAATIIALVVISSIRMSHLKKIQRGGK